MVNANELRIGNWLEFHLYGEKWVQQIDQFDFEFISEGVLHCANPIPITKEWLVKFGFKECKGYGIEYGIFKISDMEIFCYDIQNKQVWIMEKGNNISHWIKRKIEYIHELQNLYLDLRGQELTIKN